VAAYFHGVAIFNDAMRERLFSPDFRRSLNHYEAVEVLRRHARACPAEDPLSRVQYLDMKTYLAGDILTKVDRASMAHGLEVRVPLLDHQLVEWISGLPPDLKLRGAEGKYILKKSLLPYLPHELLYRKKMGFSVPLAHWMRGPLRLRLQHALMGKTLHHSGMFNMAYVQQMLDQHQSGRHDHSAALWTLLMFESFLRNVLEQPATHEQVAA
jgi:asparagine synthase (glutamine-hydrolysing)